MTLFALSIKMYLMAASFEFSQLRHVASAARAGILRFSPLCHRDGALSPDSSGELHNILLLQGLPYRSVEELRSLKSESNS
jgi:hypothetical protein